MELPNPPFSARSSDIIYRATYYYSTAFVIVAIGYVSFSSLMERDQWLDVLSVLYYPSYTLHFLGSANLLAIVALLLPGCPTIKEWAYAGIGIELVLGCYSHVQAGDAPQYWQMPLYLLAITALSYVLRPEVRIRFELLRDVDFWSYLRRL